MRVVSFEPDMAQNLGALMRLCACLGVGLDVIEPCGFPFDLRRFRRTAMDYVDAVDLTRHASWDAFLDDLPGHSANGSAARLVLLTTHGRTSHWDTVFRPGDRLILGRESAGVPDHVHARADLAIRVPMVPAVRSLNVTTAAAMVLSEALRQIGPRPDQGADPGPPTAHRREG